MVLEQLGDIFYLTTVLFALLTALFGLFMLNTLFGNKIKDLFSDKNFFIYFSLVVGYSLFAMGELTWYLIFKVFGKVDPASMPDVYWTLGSAVLVLSFFAFAVMLHRTHRDLNKLMLMIVGGLVLLGGVIFYLSGIDLVKLAANRGHVFIGFFYPIADCFIIAFGSIIPLYYSKIEHFRNSLLLLFLASVGILIGDLLYISTTVEEAGPTLFYNLAYSVSYILAALGFLTMVLSARRKISG